MLRSCYDRVTLVLRSCYAHVTLVLHYIIFTYIYRAAVSPLLIDPDTGRIFPQTPFISFKRDKNIGNFFSQLVNNPELLNAHAHDAKHVLSFATLRNCRDPSDPLRSLIILPVPQPMSFTV